MIDLEGAYVRAYLAGIDARARDAAIAFDWVDGRPDLLPAELVPPFESGSDGETAWKRFKTQVQTLGPRALRFKRDGTIGTINWGGDNPGGIDQKLEDLDLTSLANQALKSLFTVGIAAAWAHVPADGRAPRIQRLGGYIEPLYAEDDAAGEIVGLYQVRAAAAAEPRYTIRIYEFNLDDPSTGTIHEWRNARTVYEVGRNPTETIPDTSMPRYQVRDRDEDGHPLGEFMQALPIVRQELAQQLRILRVADNHAWPLMFAAGDWDLPRNLGANSILVSDNPAAHAGRIEPSDLSGLFTLHDRVLERFRGDLALPQSSIPTADFPSGEALEQANASYHASCKSYANLIGKLLSDVVADYADLLGISREQAPRVSVNVNRDSARVAITDAARADYREGLISFRAAVTAISAYYPDWPDDEIEEFIEAGQQSISLEDFTATMEAEAEGES